VHWIASLRRSFDHAHTTYPLFGLLRSVIDYHEVYDHPITAPSSARGAPLRSLRLRLCGQMIGVCTGSPQSNFLGLPMTCRQIHHETKFLIYWNNTFRTNFGDRLLDWLYTRTIHQLSVITTIRFEAKMFFSGLSESQQWRFVNRFRAFATPEMHLCLVMLPSLRAVVLRVETVAFQHQGVPYHGPSRSDMLHLLLNEINEVEERSYQAIQVIVEYGEIRLKNLTTD